MAKQYHPDVLGSGATAAETEAARRRFVEVAAAYEAASTRLLEAEGLATDGEF